MKVIERASGMEFTAKRVDNEYFEVFSPSGKTSKKLKESTFKKYFKPLKEATTEAKPEETKTEAKATKAAEPKKAAKVITGEKRQQIIEKIKKLLTLSGNNSNEEEAIQAAIKAQQLMAEYAIDEDETLDEIKGDDFTIESAFSQQKHDSSLHAWRKQLAVIVADNFRCKCYMKGGDVVFRGYKQDADIALGVYTFLYNTGDKLGSKAYMDQLKNTGSGKGAYNSFVMGFLKGVREGLTVQCTALMLVTPKAVEEEFKKFAANFKPGKAQTITISDMELFYKGKAEGKAAVKSRSIEAKGE